ncbi:MAG: ThuA domain-containing protein [Candidatus Sumerlaeota bacterium]|nr:ThuA domain-containing protein [Candidatus Sumerlaeota bacterium]
MRTVVILSLAATFACSAAAHPADSGPASAPSASGRLRALIVTGGHNFDRPAFFAMFNGFPGIEWREVKHPEAYNSFAPDQRNWFDVVALYDMAKAITDTQKAWFVDTLNEGKGVLVLHHALASCQDWPEFTTIAGGKYLQSPQEFDGATWPKSTFRHDVALTIQIADKQHPITKGLSDFDLVDEVYGGYWVSPGVHPLLRTNHRESGEILGWTKPYGKARVACLVGGHGPSAYNDANFRTLVERALLWVGGRLG